jgi:transcriptional regulator with XRE-family HTH domain
MAARRKDDKVGKKAPKISPKTDENQLFNARWFREQCARVGISLSEVARKLDIQQAALSHVLAGRRKLTAQEMVEISVIFGVPVLDVMVAAGLNVSGISSSDVVGASSSSGKAGANPVKISGWIDGRLQIHWGEAKGPKVVPSPMAGVSLGALRCQTAGGALDHMDGALFFFRNDPESFDPEALGRLSIVKVSGGGHLIRIIKRGYDTGRHNLYLPDGTLKEESVVVISAKPIISAKF